MGGIVAGRFSRARLLVRGVAAPVVALALVLVGLTAIPSQAGTFPGVNGKIAFASNVDGDYDIYTANPDGSGLVNVTNNNNTTDIEPSWSPDGSKIAYSRFDAADALYRIYTISAGGGTPTPITDDTTEHAHAPTWSPDGSKIAYGSFDGSDPEIWVISGSGSGAPSQVTDDDFSDSSPAWSPDGSKIAYISVGRLYVIGSAGGTRTLITPSDNIDEAPSWSPDGTKIAYQNGDGSDREIYVVAAAGGTATNITNNTSNDYAPSWSPDGTKIAYACENNVDRDICVMSATGGAPVTVTTDTALHEMPDWGPVQAPTVITNSAAPSVSGTPQVDVELTADPGSWSPAGVTFAYKWFADGIAIPGATGQMYTPTAAGVGLHLKVKVKASKVGFTSVSTKSASVGPVVKAVFTAGEDPVIVGTEARQTWSVDPGSLDGWVPAPTAFLYTWTVGTTVVSTGATYKPGLGKVGKSVTVHIKAKRPGYVKGDRSSAPATVQAP